MKRASNYHPVQLIHGVEYYSFIPSGPLKNLVASYWSVLNATSKSISIPIIPDGCVDLISGLDTSGEIAAYFSLHRQKHVMVQPGQEVWGTRLLPSVFYSLFQVSMTEASTEDRISLRELDTVKEVHQYEESLILKTSMEEKVSSLESMLLTILGSRQLKTDVHLLFALETIYSKQGVLKLDDNRTFTVCPRQLRRIFNMYLGFSPKEFSHIVRMQSTIQQIASPGFNYFDFGFYDQSHFVRNVKEFTGFTPGHLASTYSNSLR